MDPHEQLERVYYLVTSRFSIDVRTPKLVVGDEHMWAHLQIRCRKDVARGLPDGIYDEVSHTILLPDQTESKHCAYHLCSLLGYAVQSQLNPALRRGAIAELLQCAQPEQERGAAFEAFASGMSHYIAIESLQRSDDEELREIALARDEYLTTELQRWYSSRDVTELLADRYGLPSIDWQRIMLRYIKDCPSRMQFHRDDLGYWHVTTLNPNNIAQAIKNPPMTLEKLLFL